MNVDLFLELIDELTNRTLDCESVTATALEYSACDTTSERTRRYGVVATVVSVAVFTIGPKVRVRLAGVL